MDAKKRCTRCRQYQDAAYVYGHWREASCGLFAMDIIDPIDTCSFYKERPGEGEEPEEVAHRQ